MSNRLHLLRNIAAALCLVAALCGCGGGGARQSRAGGHVRLVVQWPAPPRSPGVSRYLPTYAASLHFEIVKVDEPDVRIEKTINRPATLPATQTIVISDLMKSGTWIFAGVARQGKDGTGSTVASASANVVVVANQTVDVSLTLATAIKSLRITGQPLKAVVGSNANLTGQAVDAEGNLIFLPIDALKWTVVTGGSFAAISADGVLQAKAPGIARVRLAEEAAGVSAEADVTIQAPSGGSGLALSPYPKFRGDLGNTGRGGGAGATGAKRWQFPLAGEAIGSDATIGPDGTVYAASSRGIVYALDPTTGSKKWSFTADWSISTSCLVSAAGTAFVVTDRGHLYALDVTTGSPKWDTFVANFAQPSIGADGTLYVGGIGRLLALDGATGTKKWEFATGAGHVQGCPAVSPTGTVFVAGDTKLFALDGSTGARLWEFVPPDDPSGPLILNGSTPTLGSNGLLVLPFSGGGFPSAGGLFALNAATGAIAWQVHDNTLSGITVSAGVDGTIYLQSLSHKVRALDGATGADKWEQALAASSRAIPPTLGSDGTVYVGNGFALYALSPNDGSIRWTFLTGGGAVLASPAVGVDGTVYFGATDGVYAVR